MSSRYVGSVLCWYTSYIVFCSRLVQHYIDRRETPTRRGTRGLNPGHRQACGGGSLHTHGTLHHDDGLPHQFDPPVLFRVTI